MRDLIIYNVKDVYKGYPGGEGEIKILLSSLLFCFLKFNYLCLYEKQFVLHICIFIPGSEFL